VHSVGAFCRCIPPTWPTTYIWLRKAPDVGSAHLPTDLVLFHEHATHSATEAVAGPRVWNSLPAHLRDEEISYNSFRRELKTYWFRGDRGAM